MSSTVENRASAALLYKNGNMTCQKLFGGNSQVKLIEKAAKKVTLACWLKNTLHQEKKTEKCKTMLSICKLHKSGFQEFDTELLA